MNTKKLDPGGLNLIWDDPEGKYPYAPECCVILNVCYLVQSVL